MEASTPHTGDNGRASLAPSAMLDYATERADPRAGGNLLRNLVLFGRVLRTLGLDVNPGRMMDLSSALAHIDIGAREDFKSAARSLLVHDRDDIALFDAAFEMFWKKDIGEWRDVDLKLGSAPKKRNRPIVVAPPLTEPAALEQDPSDSPDQPPLIEVQQTYSAREALRARDFADMTEAEIAAVRQLMARFVWQLGERRTRRLRPGRERRLDLRRTLRRSLKHGGEIMTLMRRERKPKPRPLVIVADVSGSMERYTRLLLHFIFAVASSLEQPVESFVFGTRLTRITRELEHRDVAVALADVSSAVTDWGGGTRIGECLRQFNLLWARRVLGRGAIVLVISDGWDRGDPRELGAEMQRLSLSCHRLMWLNPLLGSPDYEPLTRGMTAALPYVDEFLPVHNLASLEDLAARLAAVSERRRN